MRPVLLALLCLFLISATSVRETSTPHTVWDRILAEQAHSQTYRGSRALYFNSYQEAVRLLKKAVRSNPKDARAHRQLGVALYWTGNIEEAIQSYQRSLELQPDDENTHQVLGIAFAWTGNITQAQKEFERVLEINPNRADAEMNLGSIWEVQGDFKKAIYHLKKAIKLKPGNPLFHFQLGSVYAKYRDYDRAIKSFLLALKQASQYEDVLLELGAAYERTGQLAKAERSFKKAVRLKPGDAVARLLLSSILRRQGDPERAEKMHRLALRLTPGGKTNRLSLALAFRGNKDDPAKPDPLEQFRKNIEQIPDGQSAQITIEAFGENRVNIIRQINGVEALTEPVKKRTDGFKMMFELEPGNETKRRQDIEQFMNDLHKKLDELQIDDQLRLNMDIKKDQPRSRPGKKKKRKKEKPHAVYQPRRVGNDAGLWIMGNAWMRLIEDLIEHSLAERPDSRLHRIERGIGYLQIGQADLALEIFNALIDDNDADAVAWQGRAIAFVEMGEIDAALNCYHHLLSIEPKNIIARESITWLED